MVRLKNALLNKVLGYTQLKPVLTETDKRGGNLNVRHTQVFIKNNAVFDYLKQNAQYNW